uniref:Transcription initiation factor TFIID subunit 10 n=1 Tax=Haptolina ericina TaxID=156174 RepID=A0A7S3ASN8_9EUKA|mmetsp:Transcript_33521/g.75846  ORF Transcript_33521/g.75846 Transcript_33521/m.75846 type:complete len:122 (+) Transcript_33521:41-406(+)
MASSSEVQAAEDLLLAMQDYTPIIPDEVTSHFLSLSGFHCSDVRVKRIVSLAAHKFVADLTNDALQHCKARQQGKGGKDGRLLLTTEDLSASCKEFGIHIGKPQYYANSIGRVAPDDPANP